MDKEFQLQAPSATHTPDILSLGYAAQSVIQGSSHAQYVFTPELTVATTTETGGSLHNNTKHITYDSTDYLTCRHQQGVLTGTFTSPVTDLTSSVRRLVYVVGNTVVVGVGATWDAQIPTVLTGSDLVTNGDFANWTGDDADNWTEGNSDSAEVAGQSGSGCRITTSAANGWIRQDLTVTAGKWYRLDFYYKNDPGDQFLFWIYDNDNSQYITHLRAWGHRLSSQTSYTAHSFLFKAPTGCSTARLYFGSPNNGDVVYVDTVSCKEIDEANSTTWDLINIDTETWNTIFDTQAAPQVKIRLYYGGSDPPTSYIDQMEILSTIVTARYYQVRIEITDPTPEIYAYFQNYSLKFCST
jgi:hypothetical protein